uniref:Uncharacterized protein n=1 Tax=Arundo donax TaxID=35708 RepID=A0A0A8Z6U4_ARUDO
MLNSSDIKLVKTTQHSVSC